MIECKDCQYNFKIKDVKNRNKDCFGYYWFCPECGLIIGDADRIHPLHPKLMIAFKEVKRQELMKKHRILDIFF